MARRRTPQRLTGTKSIKVVKGRIPVSTIQFQKNKLAIILALKKTKIKIKSPKERRVLERAIIKLKRANTRLQVVTLIQNLIAASLIGGGTAALIAAFVAPVFGAFGFAAAGGTTALVSGGAVIVLARKVKKNFLKIRRLKIREAEKRRRLKGLR